MMTMMTMMMMMMMMMMATLLATKIIIKVIIIIFAISSSSKKLAQEVKSYLPGDPEEDRENLSQVSGVPVAVLQKAASSPYTTTGCTTIWSTPYPILFNRHLKNNIVSMH
jgi:cell division protein FtsN